MTTQKEQTFEALHPAGTAAGYFPVIIVFIPCGAGLRVLFILKSIPMEKYILMIDDDLDDFQFISEVLSEYPGLRCHYACNALNGIELMAKYRPGAVLLDLNMPRVNGLECLKMIKDIPEIADIPVIIFSTDISDSKNHPALYDKASCCIKKPCSYEDYKLVAKRILALVNYIGR